jgi:hypothetical protein
MLSTLQVQRVIIFLYGVSRRLLINLTNLHQKPLACFGLHVDMVPMAYHRFKTLELISRNYWWPQMSCYIGTYVKTCDLYNWMKVQRHLSVSSTPQRHPRHHGR